MPNAFVDAPDWSKIPAPEDDGAADHLKGVKLPDLALPATDATSMVLSKLPGRTVLYAYPRTGLPDRPNPEGWDMIPGARGCSPQACAFRDRFDELKKLGVDHVFGLSTQDSPYQAEAAARLALPFPLLSDAGGALTKALRLPTFEAGGMTLLKRVTLILCEGAIEHVFYPVFPPDQNASVVVDWLSRISC